MQTHREAAEEAADAAFRHNLQRKERVKKPYGVDFDASRGQQRLKTCNPQGHWSGTWRMQSSVPLKRGRCRSSVCSLLLAVSRG